MAPLFVRLWEWIDAACAAVLVAPSPVGGRLSAAERRELRRWLEWTRETSADSPA
jgi:hypothetical protein